MRLFIAVDINERSKDLINKKVKYMQTEFQQKLKWVKKANWHLTLKFLGETPGKKVPVLGDILAETARQHLAFKIQFAGLGAFPAKKNPSVIFARINKGYQNLLDLYQTLEKNLVKAGFSPDKRNYKPHLTLARTYKNTDKRLVADNLKKLSDENLLNIYSDCQLINLYESKLLPEGAEYRKIKKNFLNIP